MNQILKKDLMTTPCKAIRLKCKDCTAGSLMEIRKCPLTDCPLYPYRFGKNPSRKGIGHIKNLRKKICTQVKVFSG